MCDEETFYQWYFNHKFTSMLTCDEIQRLAVKLSGKMAEYDCLWIRSNHSYEAYNYFQYKRTHAQTLLLRCLVKLSERV